MAKKKLSRTGYLLKKMAAFAMAKFATNNALALLTARVQDLEEGNEPLVLSVDFSTGYLVQTGVSSGTFGVDYETGYLTFTPNP